MTMPSPAASMSAPWLSPGGGAVDGDAEAHGLAVGRGSEDEVQVAGVVAVDHGAIGLVEDRPLAADGPVSRQRPFVEADRAGVIDMAHVVQGAAGRDEVLGASVADISL